MTFPSKEQISGQRQDSESLAHAGAENRASIDLRVKHGVESSSALVDDSKSDLGFTPSGNQLANQDTMEIYTTDEISPQYLVACSEPAYQPDQPKMLNNPPSLSQMSSDNVASFDSSCESSSHFRDSKVSGSWASSALVLKPP